MVDPTTTNRGYAVPTHGTDVDTWDAPLNANFGLIDNNLGGVSTVAVSNVDVTLNLAQYQCGTIVGSGTLTANVMLLFPAVSGWWTVKNSTTGNFYLGCRLAAGGNRICIPPGESYDIYSVGTNMAYRNLPAHIGSYWDYAGTAVPNWVTGCTVPPYLLLDGSTYSAVTYPVLNAILGTTTLPDHRGRSRYALDGGTNRITTAGSGIDGATRFSAGGAQNVTVAQANLPNTALAVTILSGEGSHDHAFTPAGGLMGLPGGGTAGFQIGGVFRNDQQALDITPATLPQMSGSTASINGGVTQTVVQSISPTLIGGIVMIRAGG